MQKRFNDFFEYILWVEGDYADHKNDKGGKTKYGITEKLAKYYECDIETLTKEKAKEIYYKEFYLRYKLDKLKSDKISLTILDWLIHSGNLVIKKVQITLNNIGIKIQKIFYQELARKDNSQVIFEIGWKNRVIKKQKKLKEMEG